jgi:hypothetical protein
VEKLFRAGVMDDFQLLTISEFGVKYLRAEPRGSLCGACFLANDGKQ